MLDCHCHILPGLDDGSPSIEESLRMAALLADFGFTKVCCTPHYLKGCYEPFPVLVRSRIQLLQRRIDDKGICLTLLCGMEYCFDEYFACHEGSPLTLGDSGVILVEIPYGGVAEIVYDHAERLVRDGYTPLIAHPERTALLFDVRQEKPSTDLSLLNLLRKVVNPPRGKEDVCPSALFLALREAGCRFQGNIGSFGGAYGAEAQRRAVYLQAEGVYDFMGTDGHSADSLSVILSESETLRESIAKGRLPDVVR